MPIKSFVAIVPGISSEAHSIANAFNTACNAEGIDAYASVACFGTTHGNQGNIVLTLSDRGAEELASKEAVPMLRQAIGGREFWIAEEVDYPSPPNPERRTVSLAYGKPEGVAAVIVSDVKKAGVHYQP